jgi:molybdopterin/thiamine biosynthesis adenylyltransferase
MNACATIAIVTHSPAACCADCDCLVHELGHINPDVAIESYTMNITTVSGFDQFKASVTDPGSGVSRVDLILSCVDNYEARITINQVCCVLLCYTYKPVFVCWIVPQACTPYKRQHVSGGGN